MRGTRIRSVTPHVLMADLPEPFAYSQAWYRRRGAMLVEIQTEDGLIGWGEAFGPPELTAPICSWLAPLLLGQDALAREALWQAAYNRLRDHGQRGLVIEAISALDIALWDIAGQALGLPVHRLLGGPLRTEVQAYATGFYRRERRDHLRYLTEEAEARVDEGFGILKLKTGWGLAEDIALTRDFRHAIGPKIGLLVDCNHAYDAPTAIAFGRAVADCDIGWFEEPVPPEDLDGYLEVKRGQPIPVAGGEASFTRWGFAEMITRRTVHILQPDVAACGGISELKKIADMAAAFGMRVNPHVWGTGVALAASLHLLAVIPDNPPGLFPNPPLLELDRSPHPVRDALLQVPIGFTGGVVRVPDGPGLGIAVDRAALARFAA
ncbi:mandelate racemase/muconate lactonizing enzyme family protein [Falsiroseomonas selenitidurans]|uniref:Mandelate racemase/muconate lactonizing enzyme family protein n=1 Tax=Falsiroseomonas selenitidurans TaxID=2716335 RepID=A0ABX1E253_9PROT|nr:mandelate racemase/muconate lactonizing enzyme family protein [Falsiroseomonas selenitidurans]NKC29903.1 mandelate racemase/muconate lactonizing enzyme family protein [Falsiroseomonas selenitidurans]OYW09313.1 MAG: mandelate racemase [Rhodospirillales bacterium 12-71-4]